MIRLDTVDDALHALAAGRPVVVVDDADRENEGDLIAAADRITPETMGMIVRYSSGFICVGLPGQTCDRLDLPPMTELNEDAHGTAYTVTVDAATGVTTGISATDRAHTSRLLVSEDAEAWDFHRPGHVVPLRAREGGVLTRPGHTEASVDLTRLAGCRPGGVLCEIVGIEDPTTMARGPELRAFADEHGLCMISIEQIADYRREREPAYGCGCGCSSIAAESSAQGGDASPADTPPLPELVHVTEARMPTTHGRFRIHAYRSAVTGMEHVALIAGDIADEDVLVRVHSECLTGDVFGSLRCDCGPQLAGALDLIVSEGRGVVLYLRGHEGRGIGLAAKLQAYALQDTGDDTIDANVHLGLPVDARDFADAAAILDDLGVRSCRLITNNPDKVRDLTDHGVVVAGRVALPVAVNPENLRYLRTKRDRMGHELEGLEELESEPAAADTAS